MALPRFSALLLALILLFAPQYASAKVSLSFNSYNGSLILPGGYPHAYVRLDGTVEETGEEVLEIYGFTPKSVVSAAMQGNVIGLVHEALPRYLKGKKNKRHFSVPLSDAQYHRVLDEVKAWQSSRYNLKSRNCLHFVAAIAGLVGIDAIVPAKLSRRPKAWLNFIGGRNPQLNAAQID